MVHYYEEDYILECLFGPKNILFCLMTFLWWEIETKGHSNEDVCVYFEELQLKQ